VKRQASAAAAPTACSSPAKIASIIAGSTIRERLSAEFGRSISQVDSAGNLADKTPNAYFTEEKRMTFRFFGIAVSSLLASLVLIGTNADSALAEELHWKTVIGIKESGDVVGVGTPHPGIGSISGGAPWQTLGGSAKVDLNTGDVKFAVKGLILAVGSVFELAGSDFPTPPKGFSGLPIGTPAGITSVKGTLVCNVTGAQGGPSVWVDTPVTTLDAQGNAHFRGKFSGPIPSDCSTNPNLDDAFLIRIGSGAFEGAWIAFGAVPSTSSCQDGENEGKC
jgi:hypothetical protein